MIQIKSQSITTEAESLHSLIFGLSLKNFAAQKSKDVTQNPAVDKNQPYHGPTLSKHKTFPAWIIRTFLLLHAICTQISYFFKSE